MINVLFGCSLIFFIYAAPVHAYMDPGTGSLILQLIIGGLAGLAISMKMFWKNIKSLFKGKK